MAAPTRSLLLASLVVVALTGCGGEAGRAESSVPSPPSISLDAGMIATVDSGLIEEGPVLSGNLVAVRTAQIRPQVGGTILVLRVRQGDVVRSGQSLALIDTTVLAGQRRSAASAVRSARIAARTAARNRDRSDTLFAAGAIAERDREAAHDQALQAAASLADAQARLAAAEQQMENAQVRAPFDGVVSEVPASAGDVVQPGSTPLAVVVDLSSLELEAAVPVENLGAVRPGAVVVFTVPAHPGRVFRGEVARVNPAVDPVTGQIRLYARVPNPDHALAAGLFAQGRVTVESVHGLSVPTEAVDEAGPTVTVRRLRGGVVEAVPVQVGLRDALADRVQISGGVAAGDTVLVGAGLGTPVGATVKLTPSDR